MFILFSISLDDLIFSIRPYQFGCNSITHFITNHHGYNICIIKILYYLSITLAKFISLFLLPLSLYKKLNFHILTFGGTIKILMLNPLEKLELVKKGQNYCWAWFLWLTLTLPLLAKQPWRFLECSGSLVSKIFQNKYFPPTPIHQSRLGSKPSYIRKSIFLAIPLLTEGLMSKLGMGLTLMYGMKWLPRSYYCKIQSLLSRFWMQMIRL